MLEKGRSPIYLPETIRVHGPYIPQNPAGKEPASPKVKHKPHLKMPEIPKPKKGRGIRKPKETILGPNANRIANEVNRMPVEEQNADPVRNFPAETNKEELYYAALAERLRAEGKLI